MKKKIHAGNSQTKAAINVYFNIRSQNKTFPINHKPSLLPTQIVQPKQSSRAVLPR